MNNNTKIPILEFKDVFFHPFSSYNIVIKNLNLTIYSQEIHLILIPESYDENSFSDVSIGLKKPAQGKVLYNIESNNNNTKLISWEDMTPSEIAYSRSTIRRVYKKNGFLSNLDVLENVILQQLHHSKRPKKEILDEVNHFIELFELNSIPSVRPSTLEIDVLKTYQWVRASLGNPSLIILDQPEYGVRKNKIKLLFDAIHENNIKNAGIIWITSSNDLWENFPINKAIKYMINEKGLKKI